MRYIVNFGQGYVGLTPTFSAFVDLDTLTPVDPGSYPTITEIPGTGSYFFEYTYGGEGDTSGHEYFFQIDGGLVVPADRRYQSGVVGPTDSMLDAPISEVAATATNIEGVVTAMDPVLSGIAALQGQPTDLSSVDTEFGRLNAIIEAQEAGGTTNIGTPADVSGTDSLFGKIYEARDAIKAKTDLIPADFTARLNELKSNMTRMLGLVKENSVLDQTIFDVKNNLTSGRLRIFGSKSDAQNGINPVAAYTITATYTPGTNNLQSYQMVRDS